MRFLSNKRRAAKRDSCEAEIVSDLRALGYRVMLLNEFDALVGKHGYLWMMDFKSQTGKPTESQQELIDAGWPLHFVRTTGEALKILMPTGEA